MQISLDFRKSFMVENETAFRLFSGMKLVIYPPKHFNGARARDLKSYLFWLRKVWENWITTALKTRQKKMYLNSQKLDLELAIIGNLLQRPKISKSIFLYMRDSHGGPIVVPPSPLESGTASKIRNKGNYFEHASVRPFPSSSSFSMAASERS